MLDLKNILKGKVVILCLGNIERGDDGIGPRFAAMIKGRVSYEVIDAGVAPENYTGVVTGIKPDNIIMVDAVQFEGRPGEIRLFSGEGLRSGRFSTHEASPKLLIDYLRSCTGAEVYLLGIQPASNRFGRGLSKEAEAAMEDLKRIFLA